MQRLCKPRHLAFKNFGDFLQSCSLWYHRANVLDCPWQVQMDWFIQNRWFTSSAYLSQLKCWGNLLTWEQNWGWQTMILAQPRGGTSKLERQIDRPSLAVFLLSFFAGPGSPILIYPPRQFWINQIRAFSRPPSWETCALPKSLSRYLLFIEYIASSGLTYVWECY